MAFPVVLSTQELCLTFTDTQQAVTDRQLTLSLSIWKAGFTATACPENCSSPQLETAGSTEGDNSVLKWDVPPPRTG